MPTATSVTTYAGPAGDHNDRAMAAVGELGAELGRRCGVDPVEVGHAVRAAPQDWAVELSRCRDQLGSMATRIDQVMSDALRPVSAITRCAVALATQPVVLRYRPDAVVVWFDAHGDLHVPTTTSTGYLGGMALSAPLGWWSSGLGSGLPADQAVLVGARDLEPEEQRLVDAGSIGFVPAGDGVAERLAAAVAGRPVYLHLDCDVLEPGVVATDYEVPGGLSLEELHACARLLAGTEVVGLEVGEYEGAASCTAADVVDALDPVL